jgi:hypothetical protein
MLKELKAKETKVESLLDVMTKIFRTEEKEIEICLEKR